MARKKADTLDEARAEINREFRGKRAGGSQIVAPSDLTEVELAVKREGMCFLKAAGYPHSYIGEALSLPRKTVKEWCKEPAMQARVGEIANDFLDGAVKLLRTYAIELIEMLVTLARTSRDDRVALQAIESALDRMGVSKVNKSSSAAVITNKNEVDITDKTGLVASVKGAPIDVQHEMAQKLEDMMALASEHGEKGDPVESA